MILSRTIVAVFKLEEVLQRNALRGEAYNLFHSFFKKKAPCVATDVATKNSRYVPYGNMQGVVLGRTLSNIYINDVYNMNVTWNMTKFVNDSEKEYSADSCDESKRRAEEDLSKMMTPKNEDILVDIPDEDLMELYRKYEPHMERAPQACCAIINGIKWRRRTGDESMSFMSPNDSWREDGTFILRMQIAASSYEIFVFTLDDECKNLYKGLMETRRIDYGRKPCIFFSKTHNKFYPTVRKIMEAKNPPKIIVSDAELLAITKEEALSNTVSCPPEVYIGGVKLSDAAKVNKYWPLHYPGSVSFVEALIKSDPGVALYLKSNNELVAWALIGPLGQISLLQVVAEHQRKGYAGVVTRLISKKIAKENNQIPYGTVLTKNTTSLRLIRKLNFECKGIVHFVIGVNEN